jgi:rare lipoprotein A
VGVRVERLHRRRARRRSAALAVAAVVGVVGAAYGGSTFADPGLLAGVDGTSDAPSPLEVALGWAEPRSVVEGEPAPAAAFATHPPNIEPNVGVWVVGGVTGRLASVTNAPARDPSYAVIGDGLTLRRVVPASVLLKGKPHDVWTNARAVGELLSAMGIEPDRNDRVSPATRAPIPTARPIRFVDVRIVTVAARISLPHRTETTYTEALPPGEREVLQRGAPGEGLDVYRVRREDGQVVARRLVERRILRSPVVERVRMGKADPPTAEGGSTVGEAVWYDPPWSGFTAAHLTLPFGTRVTVTNLATGASVTVVVNDRGPFGGRDIDLSREAFAQIAPLSQGVCPVRLAW